MNATTLFAVYLTALAIVLVVLVDKLEPEHRWKAALLALLWPVLLVAVLALAAFLTLTRTLARRRHASADDETDETDDDIESAEFREQHREARTVERRFSRFDRPE